MNDKEIIDLYLRREERAVAETQTKYGAYCSSIANNILSVPEDAEECVNDTWISVWNRIPPTIPLSLKAFLGKLVRDISLNRYIHNHAKKRYSGMEVLLDELEECIPSDFDVEQSIEQQELSDLLNRWLRELPCDEMALFVRRYYYGDSVKGLAKIQGCTENQMAQKMMKLRNRLLSRFEVGVKERVKSVLNYKEPAFWIIIVAVIACVAVAVCFLTTEQGKLQVAGSIDSNHSFVQSQMLWTNSTKISIKNNSGTDVTAFPFILQMVWQMFLEIK